MLFDVVNILGVNRTVNIDWLVCTKESQQY